MAAALVTARLVLVLGLAAPLTARAQQAGELAGWLSPEMGRQAARASYRLETSPSQDVSGQSGGLGYVANGFSFLTPLAQDAGQELALGARVEHLALDTSVVLPDTRRALPGQLWDPRLSGFYRRKLDNGWIAGLTAEGGSPSDKPFHSENELSINATAFLRLPRGERDAWVLLLNYDHNRDFLYRLPIPGAAYWYHPSPGFQALLGAPFVSLRWLPARDLEMAATYLAPYRVRAKASYRLAAPLKAYLGFDWGSQRWFLADRPHQENRLFFWQKKASLGAVCQLGRGLDLDLAVGYTFDRVIFEGENYGDRDHDRLDLDDGAFFTAQIGFRF